MVSHLRRLRPTKWRNLSSGQYICSHAESRRRLTTFGLSAQKGNLVFSRKTGLHHLRVLSQASLGVKRCGKTQVGERFKVIQELVPTRLTVDWDSGQRNERTSSNVARHRRPCIPLIICFGLCDQWVHSSGQKADRDSCKRNQGVQRRCCSRHWSWEVGKRHYKFAQTKATTPQLTNVARAAVTANLEDTSSDKSD